MNFCFALLYLTVDSLSANVPEKTIFLETMYVGIETMKEENYLKANLKEKILWSFYEEER